jgi:hypothetical protein
MLKNILHKITLGKKNKKSKILNNQPNYSVLLENFKKEVSIQS